MHLRCRSSPLCLALLEPLAVLLAPVHALHLRGGCITCGALGFTLGFHGAACQLASTCGLDLRGGTGVAFILQAAECIAVPILLVMRRRAVADGCERAQITHGALQFSGGCLGLGQRTGLGLRLQLELVPGLDACASSLLSSGGLRIRVGIVAQDATQVGASVGYAVVLAKVCHAR